MGAGTLSKHSDGQNIFIDVEKVKNSNAKEIAAIVTSFGASYEIYSKAIVDNGVDGQLLGELSLNEIPTLVKTIGATNAIHSKKITLFFKSFKEKQIAAAEQTTSRSFNEGGSRSGTRKIRRTSIGHSVEKQQVSSEAIAELQAVLAVEVAKQASDTKIDIPTRSNASNTSNIPQSEQTLQSTSSGSIQIQPSDISC